MTRSRFPWGPPRFHPFPSYSAAHARNTPPPEVAWGQGAGWRAGGWAGWLAGWARLAGWLGWLAGWLAWLAGWARLAGWAGWAGLAGLAGLPGSLGKGLWATTADYRFRYMSCIHVYIMYSCIRMYICIYIYMYVYLHVSRL